MPFIAKLLDLGEEVGGSSPLVCQQDHWKEAPDGAVSSSRKSSIAPHTYKVREHLFKNCPQ